MSEEYAGLVSRLEALGVEVDRELRFDGKVTRFGLKGKKKRNVWVIGREWKSALYAVFGDWSGHFPDQKWSNRPEREGRNPGGDEAQVWALLRKKREEAETMEAENAARIAQAMWAEASEGAASHPYVLKKGIQPHGLKVLRGELLVPYYDAAGNISTVQRILPDGTKLLLTNGAIAGRCHVIPPDTDHQNGPAYICEGWATGATINELTGCKVLVCCSASNLEAVARQYRTWHPEARIVVAADNDHKTCVGTGKNPGLEYGKKAAETAQAELVSPPEWMEGSDFNDMAAGGLGGLAREILTGTRDMVSVAEIMRTIYKPIRWAVEGILPEGFTVLAGAPKFGKSWLMLALCFAVATGEQAWGYGKTAPCGVLYLALEDSPRRIQDRVDVMCYEEYPENIYVMHEAPRLNEGFVAWLTGILDKRPEIGVVIIDTLQKIRPAATGRRNLYQAEYDDLSALQKLGISRGVCVIGVHHTRKRSARGEPDNPMDEISGSSGIQGVADTIIVCWRKGADGKMLVTGREVNENTYPMHIDHMDMHWAIRAPEDQAIDVGPMILANWFQEHETITAKELAGMEKCNLRKAQRKLKELVDKGKLVAGDEKAPKPTTYRKMAIFA